MRNPRYFRIVAPADRLSQVEELLAAEGFRFEPEPFSIFCRKLIFEPFPLGASLAAVFGYIYIQDRSSMLPPLALGIIPGSAILDISASPGSKTGFLAQLAGLDGFVLANEPNRARLGTLRDNLQRLNLVQVATSSYDGANLPLFAHSWSYILLDPPCSAWGTLEKNPRAAQIWQGQKLARLINIQKRLLAKAAQLLAPGGKLLYSTCTTNPAENEHQTRYAIAELGLTPLSMPAFPGFTCTESRDHGVTIDGAASEAQGFYLSLLTRSGGNEETGPTFSPIDPIPVAKLENPVFYPPLLPPGEAGLFNGTVRFLPVQAATLPASLVWQAAPLGRWQRNQLHPPAALKSFLPSLDVDAPRLVFDEAGPIRTILSGALLRTALPDGHAGLWWRELPLGICQIRQGRIIMSFKTLAGQ